MSAANLTPWFPCVDAQPSRVGWYDVKPHLSPPSKERLWWDGVMWRRHPMGITTSFGNGGRRWPGDSWRGQVRP